MVTVSNIEAAAERIRPLAKRTPVLTSRLFDAEAGAECFFKCENFQRGGAFKIRGAANFLFSLTPEDRERGVVAFSSGNHAQATAIAAAHFKVPATIAMPTDAPKSKVDATRAYGANIVHYDRLRDDREAIGRAIAAETGGALVPPFDHEWIIAGQGTCALELLAEVSNLDTLLVCVGGGGLLAGCSIAARALQPSIRILGVEPEQANDTWLSMQAGVRTSIPPPDTIADGLRPNAPGVLTFPIIQENVEEILLVSEEEIRQAQHFVQSRLKIVVEPSGAVAPAAALFRKLPEGAKRVGIVISGGNV
jgi:threonine dehydratase